MTRFMACFIYIYIKKTCAWFGNVGRALLVKLWLAYPPPLYFPSLDSEFRTIKFILQV